MQQEDTIIAKQSLKIGKTESFVNKLSEILIKYEKQNTELKARGEFNLQQSNFTMKRCVEEIGSFVIKMYLKKNIKSKKGLGRSYGYK